MSCIRTFTGMKVDPRSMTAAQINIQDIAHSLSMQCRFAGHVRQFISVAQHSVNVSKHCDPRDALWGLLHDASEAYVTDLPRPLKYTPELSGFVKLEERLQGEVAKRFSLPMPIPESVHEADTVELLTEWASFKPLGAPEQNGVLSEYQARDDFMISWAPSVAERAFLARFEELVK